MRWSRPSSRPSRHGSRFGGAMA